MDVLSDRLTEQVQIELYGVENLNSNSNYDNSESS